MTARRPCPHCGRPTALRQDDTPRAHWLIDAEGRRPIGRRCPGVGRPLAAGGTS